MEVAANMQLRRFKKRGWAVTGLFAWRRWWLSVCPPCPNGSSPPENKLKAGHNGLVSLADQCNPGGLAVGIQLEAGHVEMPGLNIYHLAMKGSRYGISHQGHVIIRG
jgi:hypothetical protein